MTVARWIEEVRKTIQDDSIDIDVVLNFAPNESPADSPLRQSIETVLKRLHPGAGLAEEVQGGFTDSHFFRDKGIASYGFVPFPMSESDLLRVHGNDERIPLGAFGDGVRILWEVVYDFSRENR
jgi:acetylornithine deacetylase/succinyl-diaminopimelate desuccinylase-like protein